MPFLHRDGVALFYEEAKGAAPPVLLVHGWCCDHSHLAPQLEHFAQLGQRVVAVDLRGHGKSDKPRQPYTMQVFADDLAFMCDQLQLVKPVVIGHSMGGIVAFDLAARYPDLASAIVMLDSGLVMPDSVPPRIAELIKGLRGPDYQAVLRDFVTTALFIPTDDPARKTRILDTMASASQYMMVSVLEEWRDYNPSEVAGQLVAPCLYIAADEAQPRSDMSRLHALLPQCFHGKTVGSGHFCQLEVPEQVNAMIDRFLAIAHKETG